MTRVLLPLLLFAFCALGTIYSITVPLWEGPDEVEHMQYVRYLATQHALPAAPLPSIQSAGNEESTQAPLYYLLAALPASLFDMQNLDAVRPNPRLNAPGDPARFAVVAHTEDESQPWRAIALAAHIVRLLSVLSGTLTILLTFLIARRLWRGRPVAEAIALAAAALLAFTPGFIFMHAVINNDSAAILTSALVIYLAVSLPLPGETGTAPGFTRRAALAFALLGAGLGLALLAKANNILLGGLLLFMLAACAWLQRRLPWRETLVAGLAALLVAGPWYIRNLLIYGTVLPKENFLAASIASAARKPDWPLFVRLSETMLTSFWGDFGWLNVPMAPAVYFTLSLLALVALAGLIPALRTRTRAENGCTAQHHCTTVSTNTNIRLGIAAIWSAAVIAIVLYRALNTQGVMAGTEHARFIYPVAPVIAALLAGGVAGLAARYTYPALAILSAGMLLLAVLVVPTVIVPAYSAPLLPTWTLTPWPSTPAGFHPLDTTLDGRIRLRGYALKQGDRQHLQVILYWQALSSDLEDLTVFVHLDQQGSELHGQNDAPPAITTRDWRSGDFIRDTHSLALSGTVAPGAPLRLEIGLYRQPDLQRLPVTAGGSGTSITFQAIADR